MFVNLNPKLSNLVPEKGLKKKTIYCLTCSASSLPKRAEFLGSKYLVLILL